MRIVYTLALAAAFALLVPASLAQIAASPEAGIATEAPVRSNTSKLFLQAHLNGTGLSVEDGDTESGGGFGLKLGYGFSPLFTLYAGFDAASMDAAGGGSYSYGLFDLGMQLNFRSGPHALVPYLDLALSGQAAVLDVEGDDFTFSGAGLTLGGGLKYFVSPVLALDGSLTMTPGRFTTVKYQGVSVEDEEGLGTTGARFGLGISWYPQR